MKKIIPWIVILVVAASFLIIFFKVPLFTIELDYTACSVDECGPAHFSQKVPLRDYLLWKNSGVFPQSKNIIDPRSVVS